MCSVTAGNPRWWSYPPRVRLPPDAEIQMVSFCLLLLKIFHLVICPLITIINGRWTVGSGNCATLTAGSCKCLEGAGQAELGCLLVCAGEAAAQLVPNLTGHNYQNSRGSVSRTKWGKKERNEASLWCNWDAELQLEGGKQQCKGVDLPLHRSHRGARGPCARLNDD